ncbi:MAG: hypothetical protein ACR2NI_02905 [Pirellulales bacterium]
MTLVIGIDEAGYGPNLGPLVIGSSSWQIDELQCDHLSTEVADQFIQLQNDIHDNYRAGRGPPWGDSKKIFTRKGMKSETLEPLERGVFAAVQIATNTLPETSDRLLSLLALKSPDDSERSCWKKINAVTLPLATKVPHAIQQAEQAAKQLRTHAIRLTGLACRWIFPETFNAALDTGMNKSDILSQASLQLAFDLRNQHPHMPAVIWCDRHGGRKRYAGVVSHCFDAARVEPLSETARCSRYRIHDGERPTFIHFTVGGESQLPVAVASMTAKYTRELAMDVFNSFWTDCIPSLQPTAGYPVDARRWWHETEKDRHRMSISDDVLWRKS